jgi:hypothetical protein
MRMANIPQKLKVAVYFKAYPCPMLRLQDILPIHNKKNTGALSRQMSSICWQDPLAEAKYVALRDGEAFNANLVNLGALHFYGGSPDIEVINEYMECFIPQRAERGQKLAELFLAAFSFVNKRSNWLAISCPGRFYPRRTQRQHHPL